MAQRNVGTMVKALHKWLISIFWETAEASNSQIRSIVVAKSLYIVTGNYVIGYFRSATNSVNATGTTDNFRVRKLMFFWSTAQIFHEIYSRCGIFDRFLNLDNCQPEVVSDVISGMVDQDVGMDECANFGDSRLKPSESSFLACFRTSITSARKYSDVISGRVVGPRGVKALLKFADSRSNRSRDI